MLEPSGRPYCRETSPSGVMVLGSLCWAASVTVSAPPAPSVDLDVDRLRDPVGVGEVRDGQCARDIGAGDRVVGERDRERAQRDHEAAEHLQRQGSGVEIDAQRPAEPRGAELHVVEVDAGAVGHVDVDGQPVLAADGQDVAAERGVDLAQQPGERGFDQARGSTMSVTPLPPS